MSSRGIFKWMKRPKFAFNTISALRNKSTTARVSKEEEDPPPRPKAEKIPTLSKRSHTLRINSFFRKNPHLAAIKSQIPEKYLALKRVTPPENLYLIDNQVAKQAANYIIPELKKNQDQILCETNAGLGFITSELLNHGAKLVRLYESCPEFKTHLKTTFEPYEGRVELFTKDIFLLHRYEYIDKQDHGNRVEQLLKGVPRRSWNEDPVMTIIGPLPNRNFIRFVLKSLVLQTVIPAVGRIQIYGFMRPRDYVVLTAGPHLNLHTYQCWSVLFNLFFTHKLLEKFPRQVFLPWQSPKSQQTEQPGTVDPDLLYFVKIGLRKDLPVSGENLLPFYSFVMQFFGRGTNKIIPTLEKWVPGLGVDIIVPKLSHNQYFKDLNVFTQFGELTPQQVLAVFEEMIAHPEYKKSHFVDIIESHLVKTETVDSSIDEHLEKTVSENTDSEINT